ncbi:MAG: PAS domain-containing protein, partial [Rhodoferax sp.]|nr:PAS domain-containing protein [Rhodoferax sp.]
KLIGSSPDDFLHDPQDGAFFPKVKAQLHANGFWRGSAWIQRHGGASCAVHASWILLRDDQGQVLQTVGFFRDLTEEIEAQKRIEQLAYSDA